MNKFEYKNLSPFKWFVLENFPFIEADFDALTDWQLYCKLGKEINKIIDSQNVVGTQMENVTNAFIELQNYVDDYFKNLDVQDEINNKLNEMAEDGTLQEIIAKYLNTKSLLVFDNVTNMKNSENLIEGSYARTLGFHNLNDGGSKTYKIIKEQSATNVNGRTKINLGHDDLYAISLNDTINVREYGAKGDGITDDTESIQFCIDNFPHRTIYFPSGNYLISKELNIKSGNEYQVDLYLENDARIFTNNPLNELLNIGGIIEGNWDRNDIGNIVSIFGGTFDAHNTQRAIYLTADRKQTRLLNLNIINVEHFGIYIDKNFGNTTISTDALINTISITGNPDYSLDNFGIYLEGTDNELENIRITSIKYGIDINGGGNLFNNVHMTCWFGDNQTTEMINNSIGTILRGAGENYFNNYYIDTYGISIDLRNDNMHSYFNNFQVFYYQSDSNSKYIVFNFKSKCYVKCTNCSFVLPENSGSNKITNFTSNVEYDTRKYPVLKEILRFTNCDAINIKAERDLFNEITVNKDFDNSYNLNNNPWSASMNQNSWYKVLLLSEGFHKFIVQIANDQISEVEIFVDRSNSRITVKDLYHSNFHNKSFNVALANGFIDDTDIYFAYLVFQSIDNDSQLNITIENIKNTWATQKYAVGSMIPLDNPTIVTQSNLLPN